MKFLLWAVLIGAVIWVLRNKQKAAQSRVQPRQPSSFPHNTPDTSSASEKRGETMLRCAHCGTHFPASEAVFDAARSPFCSSEHRQLHAVR